MSESLGEAFPRGQVTADPTGQLVDALTAIGWGMSGLLGLDVEQFIRDRAEARAPVMVAQLGGDDDRLAAETCTDVMGALWPHCLPEDCGQGEWWTTPLGRLCARSLGRDDSEAVTQSVAAAMLGVTRGTIAQWLARGTIDRHPDGGVLRSSVIARLAAGPDARGRIES